MFFGAQKSVRLNHRGLSSKLIVSLAECNVIQIETTTHLLTMHVFRIHKAIELNTYTFSFTVCPFLLKKVIRCFRLCLRFYMNERVRLVLVFNTLGAAFHNNTTRNTHATHIHAR